MICVLACFLAMSGRVFATGWVEYPAQSLSLRGIDRIQVSGVAGEVKLQHRAGPMMKLNVRHSRGRVSEDWHLSMERKGKTLVLEVFHAAFGSDWKKLVRRDLWPRFDIELIGPSRPVSLAWREGRVVAVGWRAPLDISLLSGTFEGRQLTSDLVLNGQELNVSLADVRGDLHLRADQGLARIQRVNGSVAADWARGEFHATQLRRGLTLQGQNVLVNVADLAGKSAVSVVAGEVKLQNIKGPLTGQGASSKWQVRGRLPKSLDISSQSGSVVILNRDSGVQARLFSRTGAVKVNAPGFLKKQHAGKTWATKDPVGQLRRSGVVRVQTQTGEILWR